MISIIIPVYNGEKYIKRAIDSVLSQKGVWELIIVDDHSNDKTMSIIQQLINSDSPITLIESPSKGVTDARMAGAHVSKYPFLFFMDADDEIPRNTIETIQHKIKENPHADIVTGDIMEIKDNICQHIKYSSSIINTGNELFDFIIDNRIGYIWGKAIRKDLFLSLPYIPSKLKFCEDYIQMLQLTLKASTVCHINKPSYIYYQNPYSACNSVKSRKDFAMQFYNLCNALKILFCHPDFDSSYYSESQIRPALRLKVMFLFYCRLYLAIYGGWGNDPNNLKDTYRQILHDNSIFKDPLYDKRRHRQTIVSYYFPWLIAAIYIPLLKYKYHRIK